MVNLQNLKHTVMLGGILLSIEFLGNKFFNSIPNDDLVFSILAIVVLIGGLYFHIIKA